MKLKKIARWVSRITTILLFLALTFMAFAVIASKASGGEPEIFGVQLKTVLSGSMEPNIKTGSIIAVDPDVNKEKLQKNDVITFIEEDNKLITHRIIEVINSGDNVVYRTKGDNNNGPDRDLVLSENVVAKYTGFSIPYLGYLINFSQSKNGAFMLIIPGILMILYSGYTIWKALSVLETNNKRNHKKDVSDGVSS